MRRRRSWSRPSRSQRRSWARPSRRPRRSARPPPDEEASMKEDDRKRVSPDNFDTIPDDDGISPAVRKQRAARLAERNATRDANAHGAHAAAVFEQKRVASMEPEEIKDPSAP